MKKFSAPFIFNFILISVIFIAYSFVYIRDIRASDTTYVNVLNDVPVAIPFKYVKECHFQSHDITGYHCEEVTFETEDGKWIVIRSTINTEK